MLPLLVGPLHAQQGDSGSTAASAQERARRFVAGRTPGDASGKPSQLLKQARQDQQQLLLQRSALQRNITGALRASPQNGTSFTTPLTTAWQPVGPLQVQTAAYGLVTGRVSSVAVDPADATGNTVYLGTTGGGVWKSTNAAGAVASVSFSPLTDTPSPFSANAGTGVFPSISIGAVTVQPGGSGVVLAGTGDPNDATDSYYGQGILRSTDSGASWSLVQQSSDGAAGPHSFVGEGFAGFAWSTTSSNLVVAAVSSSAEGTLVQASTLGYSVRGLYYSTDAGATWRMATVQDGSQVVQNASSNFAAYEGNAATAVVWNPVRRRFYAAVRYHGYYESTDGQTWTRLAAQPGSGLSTTACPVRSGAAGSTACPIFRGALAAQPSSGDLFALTVGTNNADTGLYQDACNLSGSVCGNATVGWGRQLVSTPLESGSTGAIPQGDYNLALAAVPAATALSQTDTLLFAGVGDLFRCKLSDANGCALRNTTNATTGCAAPAMVAPSQHAIAFQTFSANSAAPLVFFGNDGGLWRSPDGVNQQAAACSADDATHFDNLNGGLGSLAEISGLSMHPTDGGILLAALGGLGSAAALTPSVSANVATVWSQMGTGESESVAIDPADPRNWLVQSGYGVSLKLCSNGTGCTSADFAGAPDIGPAQVNNDAELLDTPAMLDPALSTNVLAGTCRIYRGPAGGGSSWTGNAISAPLSGPANAVCSSANGLVRSLGAGGVAVVTGSARTSGSPVIYAGMAGTADGGGNTAGGHIFRNLQANLAGGSTAWSDRSSGTVSNDSVHGYQFNPRGFDVSSISVDPNDSTGNTVYATVSGFGVPLVYRSTDGATTWTNVTANLPLAPASAVLVDPNDSHIVYLATDTGVYVTTDIATCTSTNAQCWSPYGTGLPLSPAVQLAASTGYGISGSVGNGTLRVGTYGRGAWQIPLLTAGQMAAPAGTLSPTTVTFGSTAIGYTSSAQTVTVLNGNATPLTVTGVVASSGFIQTNNCTGNSLGRGDTCTVQVSFAPGMLGSSTGTLTVYANVTGGYLVASLSGTGTGTPRVVVSPASVVFPDTRVHATSSPQTVTVTNSGTQTAALQTPTTSGDYTIAVNRCDATLAPSASCSFDVAFTPSASGVRTAIALLVDDNGTHSVPLTGIGTAGVATLSPATITFSTTPLNGVSPVRTVTVSNTGNGTLQVGALIVTGDFTETDTCAHVALPSGSSCIVSITFSPTQSGSRTGALVVASDSNADASSTAVVALQGSAQANFSVVLTPLSLSFGATAVGANSAVQNITVSNTGTSAGAVGAVTVSGDFAVKGNTCGATLAPQTGCTVSIAFAPTASGMRSGVFTIATDAGSQTAALAGTGLSPATDTLSPLSLAFAGQVAGTSSAAQAVTLTNSGDTALTLVTANVTSGDFSATNGCGPSLAAHSTCSIAVNFAPRSVGTQTGTLVISDVQRTQMIALTGTGLAGAGLSLLPVSLGFAQTGVGNATAPQIATLTNNANVHITLGAIGVSGDFGLTAAANACSSGAVLVAGSACTLSIAFAPKASGARTGSLTVSNSGATQMLALSGTGVDYTFAATGPTTATVVTGKSVAYALLLTPASATSDALTFTCTGAPANTKCTVVSTYSNLTATSTVTVTVLTGTTAALHIEPDWSGRGLSRTVALCALFPALLCLRVWRRRSTLPLVLSTVLLCVGLGGCGSGRKIPDSTGSTGSTGTSLVTPAGTYTLTVSASAAGLTRQLPLTLVVTAQ